MIAAGFGFSTKATVESLQDAFAKASRGQVVTHLAAPEDKTVSKVFTMFRDHAALPVIDITPDALIGAETFTKSERAQAQRGVGSVAEAAALSATGGRLLAPRSVSDDRMATCAIAIGDHK